VIENKIIQVFTSSGMSRLEFATKLNISNAVLSHLASGRNKASLDLVIAVLTHFPKINSEWLILNKGEMYKSEIDDREALKSELNGQIQALISTNQKMTGQLQSFVKAVEELK
jgi:hypothetical protein